jgi:hypothetical protein
MNWFAGLFHKKKIETPKPRYQILEGNSTSAYILDTKEDMKLGLQIEHSTYDAGAISHEDYPDGDKNGCTTHLTVVIGDRYPSHGTDAAPYFNWSAEVRDNTLDRLANYDDTDFKMLKMLQAQMADSSDEKGQQTAYLALTLLKVVKSPILTAEERVTEEYRAAQKAKEQAEKKAKAKKAQKEQEAYRKAREEEAKRKQQEIEKRQTKEKNYMQTLLDELKNQKF